MILRKPYALLIKYFKVIHLFICAIIGYLIYRTSSVLSFFNGYATSLESVIGQSTIKSLLNGVSIILPLFIVLLSAVILYLMRYKKKPVLFYIFNIISYVFVAAIFYYANGVLNDMYVKVVDIRIVMLVRDLITGVMIVEWVTLIVSVVRATGFDIKKFNFVQDLEELDVDAKDREEFEVNIEIDTDKLKRGWNRSLRHTQYIYKENKTLINIIASVIIVVLLGIGYREIVVKNKVYSESEFFTGDGFNMQIRGSYLTDRSGTGKVINKKYTYVLVELSVQNTYGTDRKFDITRPALVIDGKKYYNDIEEAEAFTEFGDTYYGEALGKEEQIYLLIYQVPKKESLKKMQFQFIDQGSTGKIDDVTKFHLEPTDLTGTSEEKTTQLGKILTFKDPILKDATLKITGMEIAETFKIGYQYCLEDGNCISSNEYLTPTVDEYYKNILKVKGTFKLNKNSKMENLDIAALLEKYGTLEYVVDGKTKTTNIPLKKLKPKRTTIKNEGYVEVLQEIKNATAITLKLTLYNTTYSYKLK